ncbi:uncharacterized protein JCM15063_003377 [Sporobolomyces koalae]|uniref:uncharacterized protein n=1 Tax=Sporobolomyces koalae TaxID=500713 RepID=UPI003174C1FD
MGAMCGKEDHFDQLGSSKGHTLGGGNVLERQPTPHVPRQKPPPRPAQPPAATRSNEPAVDREAMLKAVEARSEAAKTRGTNGGKLAKQLEEQKRDRTRRDELGPSEPPLVASLDPVSKPSGLSVSADIFSTQWD